MLPGQTKTEILILHVCQNANQLLVVLVGLLLKSVELLLKSTDTACCGYIWNQYHLVGDGSQHRLGRLGGGSQQ